MERTALALILALLFSATAGTQIVSLAKANPHTLTYAHIYIESPQDKVYYDTETILLNFTEKTNNGEWLRNSSYYYFLDGQDYRRESVKVEEIRDFVLGEEYCYEGHVVLSNLSIGQHRLNVFLGYVDSDGLIQVGQDSSPQVHFSIESKPFPTTLIFVASVVSVAVIGSGLAVYFKKRKR